MTLSLPQHSLPMLLVTQVAFLTYISTPKQGVNLNHLSSKAPEETKNWTGKRLPDVPLDLLDGHTWKPSLVRDRPTVLLVLTQCGYCGAPFIMDWDDYQRHHPALDVVAVSGDDPAGIREVVRRELPKSTRIRFASYQGTDALRRWRILRPPRVFVLNQEGWVDFAHPGVYDDHGARDALEGRLTTSMKVALSVRVRQNSK